MSFTAPVFTKQLQFLWTFRMPNFVEIGQKCEAYSQHFIYIKN